jgi:hypothetical protein
MTDIEAILTQATKEDLEAIQREAREAIWLEGD